MFRVLTFLTILSFASAAAETQSDTAKEARWAEQVVDTLFDGEAVWLDASGHRFLGLDMPAESGALQRAVILSHGIGIHPNWEQVIKPLRVELAAANWHTLSIQMPILSNDAESAAYAPLFAEVPSRFNAAKEYLLGKGINQIVLVGHSMGAAMMASYLADEKTAGIAGAVLIGLGAGRKDAPVDAEKLIAEIRLPTLDLYGEQDLQDVVASTELRASAASSNQRYTQRMIMAADHFFDDHEDALVEAVQSWIDGL